MNSLINKSREWLKVSQLSAGMQIAVPKNSAFAGHAVSAADESVLEHDAGDVLWDEIEEIRELPEEQVWDIEVEGTHNFVAGHLLHKDTGELFTEEEEKEWLKEQRTEAVYGGIFAHNTYLDGSVGIGSANPNAKLSILDQTSDLRDAFTVATSTSGNIFRVDTAGDAHAQGSFNSGGADYAEHFVADSDDLVPGEVVCVSLENENAVSRCIRPRDGNIMGIVSTNPAIIGNSGNIEQGNSVVVGMLGQVPARVTNENGEIRPGDSLTSASVAGYAMKASAGDPTVGVALERLNGSIGTVRVLISRRNKSLTVEQVEEAVVARIAAMEIEDEVAILVSDAVDAYDFDPVVSDIIGGELAALSDKFSLNLSKEVAALDKKASDRANALAADLSALRMRVEANELDLVEESLDRVAVNTNLTIAGALDAAGGITVPWFGAGDSIASLQNDASSTPVAFKVAPDGTVTAYNDFIISDGVNATSVKETLAALGAETMTKTELTVRQDLYVGDSFEVWGRQGTVAGASMSATGRPVFRVAADGTVTIREDLVLSGYESWNDIEGIVSLFAYDTALDVDGGAWVTGNRSASWYNEALDATATACDISQDSRCGSRSFPQQAFIAATSDTVYIFNARDGSLWKKQTNLGGGITAVYAQDSRVYVAHEGTVSVIDFGADTTESIAVAAGVVSGMHSQRINGEAYLAVAGDAGIDLVRVSDASSIHYSGAATDVRLTEAGDMYSLGNDTLSVFTRAYAATELSPSATYSATSTHGLYVTQDGQTTYTAFGATIRAISQGVTTPLSVGEPIVNFSVDEAAQVIYVATVDNVQALALGDGSVLASYDQPNTTLVASFTRTGSIHEGDLLSDTLIMATPKGVRAQGADMSVRSGLANNKTTSEQAGRLRVTSEAVFSGRLTVVDQERAPRFAIDDTTGDVVVREDVQFAADSRMQSIPGVASVFAYDTTLDSDGGQWRANVLDAKSIRAAVFGGTFPQSVILTASDTEVRVYNARTKALWGVYGVSALPSIAGIAARDGRVAVYGDAGLVFVDLATGQETGLDDAARAIVSFAFSGTSDWYYATQSGVYTKYGKNILIGASAVPVGASVTSIAVSGNTLYIGHSSGITSLNLATNSIATVGAFTDVASVSVIGSGNVLVAHGSDVAEVSSSGVVLDRWTSEEERIDSQGLAYAATRVFGASASNGVRAIAVQAPTGDRFVWMETGKLSLRDALNAPKNVFTVIDRLQTPRISSIANLSFTASSTISFYTGATSTPALVVRENGDISISGNVGIGTTTPEFMLDVAGTARFGATQASELRINGGYLQLNAVQGKPTAKDCASTSAYGRMVFDGKADTLYVCGKEGWNAFTGQGASSTSPTTTPTPEPEPEPIVEETATTTPETVPIDTATSTAPNMTMAP